MIHQYKLNGYNIVLDVYSGSVHAVDELAYAAFATGVSRIRFATSKATPAQKLPTCWQRNMLTIPK